MKTKFLELWAAAKAYFILNKKVIALTAALTLLVVVAIVFAFLLITGKVIFTGAPTPIEALVILGVLMVIQLAEINSNLSKIAKK